MPVEHGFLNRLLVNPWIAFLGAIASIIALLWFAHDKLGTSLNDWSSGQIILLIACVLGVVAVLSLSWHSVHIQHENQKLTDALKKSDAALKISANFIHEINHDYRDVLHSMFGSQQKPDLQTRQKHQLSTITAACQKIQKLYQNIIGVDCTVTVNFLRQENDHRYCEAYARSELHSPRDKPSNKYVVGTGENTALDTALRHEPGKISRFYCGDLTKLAKDGNYQNRRLNWDTFYKSAIVVPIRYVDQTKLGTPSASDDYGFLSVDTLSVNCLNNDFHIDLMASFADQMYNFISLMRGRYEVTGTVDSGMRSAVSDPTKSL